MNKSPLKIFIFLLSFAALISCNNDRESEQQNNYFTVDGGAPNVIETATASFSVEFSPQGDRNVASFVFTSFDRQKATGPYKTVQLGIDFPVSESINGTYSLNSRTRRIRDYSTWYTYFNGQNGVGEGNPSEATVTVTKNSGSSYNVIFSYKTETNKRITGQYNGNVIIQ